MLSRQYYTTLSLCGFKLMLYKEFKVSPRCQQPYKQFSDLFVVFMCLCAVPSAHPLRGKTWMSVGRDFAEKFAHVKPLSCP